MNVIDNFITRIVIGYLLLANILLGALSNKTAMLIVTGNLINGDVSITAVYVHHFIFAQ